MNITRVERDGVEFFTIETACELWNISVSFEKVDRPKPTPNNLRLLIT